MKSRTFHIGSAERTYGIYIFKNIPMKNINRTFPVPVKKEKEKLDFFLFSPILSVSDRERILFRIIGLI